MDKSENYWKERNPYFKKGNIFSIVLIPCAVK